MDTKYTSIKSSAMDTKVIIFEGLIEEAREEGRQEGRQEILDKLRKLRDEHGMRLMSGNVDMTDILLYEDTPPEGGE